MLRHSDDDSEVATMLTIFLLVVLIGAGVYLAIKVWPHFGDSPFL